MTKAEVRILTALGARRDQWTTALDLCEATGVEWFETLAAIETLRDMGHDIYARMGFVGTEYQIGD